MRGRLLFFLLGILFFLQTAGAHAEGLPPLLAAGGSFGVARSSDGTLWGWGDNGRGQLGNGTTARVRVPSPCFSSLDGAKVVQIACGNISTLFLMEDGTVYTCGGNNYGQQGIGSRASMVREPVQIPGLNGIVQLACGFGQCLALTDGGQVYAWGRNSHGQLGDGSKRSRDVPYLLPLSGITAVACGGKYCMALSGDGSLYGWGDNAYGQLADASRRRSVLEPVRLSLSGRFERIACGGDAAFGVDAEGILWALGRNDYLQLGTSDAPSASSEPVRVSFPEDVRVSGLAAYNAHTAAISREGMLWQWGSVYHGQVGSGLTRSRAVPLEACPPERVLLAAVGSLQSYCMLEDGSVLGAGCNEYSQTGAFRRRTDYYVREWKRTGLNLLEGTWTDPMND